MTDEWYDWRNQPPRQIVAIDYSAGYPGPRSKFLRAKREKDLWDRTTCKTCDGPQELDAKMCETCTGDLRVAEAKMSQIVEQAILEHGQRRSRDGADSLMPLREAWAAIMNQVYGASSSELQSVGYLLIAKLKDAAATYDECND